MYEKEIPDIVEAEYADRVQIVECGEKLVSLDGVSERITCFPYYAHLGYPEAAKTCCVRDGVAKLLVDAAELLPPGYRLVIWDGWRSNEMQQALYDAFYQRLLADGWPEGEALDQELIKYVAKPSSSPLRPSRHLTGGAVDVTLAGTDGWLNMGTEFDDFSPRAMTRYYETLTELSGQELQIQANRRLLYHVMTSVGFTNYPEEWWHFDYGNPPWAGNKQTTAKYGGVRALDAI